MARRALKGVREPGSEYLAISVFVFVKRDIKLISKITNPIRPPSIRQKFSGDGEDLPKKRPVISEDTDEESLMSAIDNVTNYVQNVSREIHFDVDAGAVTGKVTVVDSATGRTIRQIPALEVLEMSRDISNRVSDPIKGMLLRDKA